MDLWKDIVKELVKKLTPILAFAILIIIVIAQFGDQIPPDYRSLIYWVIGLAFIVYTVSIILQTRAKRKGDIKSGGDIKGLAVSGDQNQITQIVNHYTQAHPETQRKELEDQLDGYLHWIEESYGSIVLRGIERQDKQVLTLPLDTIYLPLQAETYEDEPSNPVQEQPSRAPKTVRDIQQDEKRQPKPVSLNQVLELGSRVIITGGPGCGKSTVLQHMAWVLAQAFCNSNSEAAREKLGLKGTLPLPIYVPLSLYAAYRRELPSTAEPDKKMLATYISEYMLERQMQLSLSPQFLAHLIAQDKDVLLLLDGLDEVPDENERAEVRQAIEDLIAGRDQLRVVVTSRTAAYRDRAVLGRGFRHVRVLPLDDEQVNQLIRRAYSAIYPTSAALAAKNANNLIEQIQELEEQRRLRLGEGIERLVSSPLMVRILIIVHFNDRKLPDQRADLYQKAVDAMLRPDYTMDEKVAVEIERLIGGSLAMSREMVQYVAFHMHQQGERQGREISEEALRMVLCREAAFYPHINGLISQTRLRGALLEERSELYRFIHLSFQEFLAARYLADKYDVKGMAQFLENEVLMESWWREPLLLLVGYLDITAPSKARQLLLRLCGAKGAEQSTDETIQLAAVELAATAFLELQHQDDELSQILQERLKSILFAPPGSKPIIPRLRADAGDVLDKMGWYPADLHRFMPVKVDGKTVYIGKYPVTNRQYARFLQADDFTDRELWLNFPCFDEHQQPMTGTWGEKGLQWLRERLKLSEVSPDGKRVLPNYWRNKLFGISRPSAPVVGVTWFEANAYCAWLLRHWQELEEAMQNPGLRPAVIRLPLKREWVAAAGGDKPAERYPWDTEHNVTYQVDEIILRANVMESGIRRTTPVWLYPSGRSPQGVCDLAGNVWEMQTNFTDEDHNVLDLRGGSWNFSHDYARVSDRDGYYPDPFWHLTGAFRVMVEMPTPS